MISCDNVISYDHLNKLKRCVINQRAVARKLLELGKRARSLSPKNKAGGEGGQIDPPPLSWLLGPIIQRDRKEESPLTVVSQSVFRHQNLELFLVHRVIYSILTGQTIVWTLFIVYMYVCMIYLEFDFIIIDCKVSDWNLEYGQNFNPRGYKWKVLCLTFSLRWYFSTPSLSGFR